MDTKEALHPKNHIYDNHLKMVNEVPFTKREVDVISCVLHNRGEKKIARILNMSPRTVGTHIYNIMQKLRCNSRDTIIDFAEQSGAISLYRQYYTHLLIEDNFRKHLATFPKKINRSPIKVAVKLDEDAKKRFSPQQKLISELEIAKIYFFADDNEADSEITELFADLNADNYYQQAFAILKKLFPKEPIKIVYQSFLDSCEIIRKGNGNNRFSVINNEVTPIHDRRNLMPVIASFIILLLLGLCFFIFVSYQNARNSNNIVQVISQLNHIGRQISVNNLHTEFYERNNSLLLQLEEVILKLDDNTIENYFRGSRFAAEELVAAIYALNSLASYYLYNENSHHKARPLLYKAKKFAENYLRSRSKIKIDFDSLSPAEHYAELSAIKDLPHIYAQTVYFLGRSYFYAGDVNSGRRYFDIAKYVGGRANDFVGFLSKQQGLAKILDQEMISAYNANDIERAILMIDNLLDLYEELLNDDTTYVNNFNPISRRFDSVEPAKQPLARITTLRQIAKYNAQLILFNPNKSDEYFNAIYKTYTKEGGILDLITADSDEIIGRHCAAPVNLLAEILLICNKFGVNSKKLQSAAIEKMQLDLAGKNIIEVLYLKSMEFSKKTDFTKADALNGLMKLEKAKGDKASKKLIERYKKDRDEINNTLNRKMFEVLYVKKETKD